MAPPKHFKVALADQRAQIQELVFFADRCQAQLNTLLRKIRVLVDQLLEEEKKEAKKKKKKNFQKAKKEYNDKRIPRSPP